MAIRANPKLIEELELYGAQDVSKCYHCGNCSATCPFSKEPYILPRRSMRSLQMGLEEKLQGDLEPWLCYYCGQCSEECPRDAEPGETMMSLRRWLTARYDFTGIARLFYLSWRWEVLSVIVVALCTGIGFLLFGFSQGSIGHYNGPDAFLPSAKIHIFDWTLAILLLALLLTNCARMWWFTVGRDSRVKIPLSAYVRKLWELPFNFLTQARFAKCDRKQPWVLHLVLMLSYVTMLVLIMFFLADMWSGPAVDWWAHSFGLAAAAGLLIATVWAIRNRLKKTAPLYQHSHETDWTFLVLLVVVSATGVLQFLLHRAGLDTAANITYVVHLMGVVPMLGLEVPFSKWSHLAYRPLAIYFADLKAEAIAAQQPAETVQRLPQAA